MYHRTYLTLISYVAPYVPNSHILCTTLYTQLPWPSYLSPYVPNFRLSSFSQPLPTRRKSKQNQKQQDKNYLNKSKNTPNNTNETWNHGICTDSCAWGPLWCGINIPRDAPLGDIDLSFLSRYQFWIASWLWVELGVYLPSQCGDGVWFEFAQGFLVCAVTLCEFMTQLLCLEGTVFWESITT